MSAFAKSGKPSSAKPHNRKASHAYSKQEEYDSPD